MTSSRIGKLRQGLRSLLLVKKKENLLYLTGRSFMSGYLLARPFGRHLKKAKRRSGAGFRPKAVPAAWEEGVVFLGDGLEKPPGIHSDILKNIGIYLGGEKALLLEDEFTFAEYNYIKRKIKDSGLKVKIEHSRSPADFLRAVKEPQEIKLVAESMAIAEKVFSQARRRLSRPGVSVFEHELAGFIRQAGLKLGAEDVSFPPIVASGLNAAVPHHVPSKKKIKSGEPVILDFGFKYKGYCSDFTRTVFIKKAPLRLAKAYNLVEKAYHAAIGHAVSGASAGRVYQEAADVLKQKKLDKYFIHGLGHGSGLEIHELPNLTPGSKDVLQEGMVFSIEPGVYLPAVGGIRIEDLVHIKKGKAEKFISVATKLADNVI